MKLPAAAVAAGSHPFFLPAVILSALLALIIFSAAPRYFVFIPSGDIPSGAAPAANSGADDNQLRILIGILTVPAKYDRRYILRLAYALQPPPVHATVDIRYVFCNVTGDDAVFVAMEILRYNDIIILNCTENMNDGKTYTYFSSVHSMFSSGAASTADSSSRPPYDYVMKADDDTYLRLSNLAGALSNVSRSDAYFGAGMGFEQGDPIFMRGMGYALSWDLVSWIAGGEVPERDRHGVEDIFLGKWLNDKGKGRRRYNMNGTMFDFRGEKDGDFAKETIAVHVLKENARWARTLRHFNVAAAVPPSRFYHLP